MQLNSRFHFGSIGSDLRVRPFFCCCAKSAEIGRIGRIGRNGTNGTNGTNGKFPILRSAHVYLIKRSAPIYPIKRQRYPSPPSSEAILFIPAPTHLLQRIKNTSISEINFLLEVIRYNARRISRRWAVHEVLPIAKIIR